ncbi:TetR/AcrR family transcriptional regulator [Amphibacillus sp. Q70]|uniref:TetR/AcrR family transcriptional regulator n=1 Tax=Amphibacillus sp. Q70 TaxID=3453416 RepID=UPI003F878E5C
MKVSHTQDRRVRRTKRQLKKAFIDLLYEKDIDSISVTDIVEKADYNRSTFYFHYKYKEELIKELNDSLLNGLINSFFTSREINFANLKSTDIGVFDYILKKKEYFVLWKTPESLPNIREEFIEKLSHVYKNKLIHTNILHKSTNLELFTIYNTYGLLGLILEWIKNDFKESPKTLTDQFIALLKNSSRIK